MQSTFSSAQQTIIYEYFFNASHRNSTCVHEVITILNLNNVIKKIMGPENLIHLFPIWIHFFADRQQNFFHLFLYLDPKVA